MTDNKKLNFQTTIPCSAKIIFKTINKILEKINDLDHNIQDLNFRIEVAAREMLTNAFEHGCHNKDEKIKIKCEVDFNKVSLTVIDPGDGFDWKSIDLTNKSDLISQKEKGRGLILINKVADEINFNEAGNIITAYFR